MQRSGHLVGLRPLKLIKIPSIIQTEACCCCQPHRAFMLDSHTLEVTYLSTLPSCSVTSPTSLVHVVPSLLECELHRESLEQEAKPCRVFTEVCPGIKSAGKLLPGVLWGEWHQVSIHHSPLRLDLVTVFLVDLAFLKGLHWPQPSRRNPQSHCLSSVTLWGRSKSKLC